MLNRVGDIILDLTNVIERFAQATDAQATHQTAAHTRQAEKSD